jgi:predicted TIM-barrel fold metal-dependent hydrolase
MRKANAGGIRVPAWRRNRLARYTRPMERSKNEAGGLSRRAFLTALSLAAGMPARLKAADIIIDIHQHTNYSGRSDVQLVAHQRAMGVAKTVLLPAGSKYGLEAGCGGNQTVVDLARQYPNEYVYFANEVSDLPGARAEIEKYLKMGAIGIGEQKFFVDCDSAAMQTIASIAQAYGVPVLLHFQHNKYNKGIERFHKMLDKYPRVNFIGHAQTWWGNIDRNHDPSVMYPKGPVAPGGISDRLLSDYPNMYGDLSAFSGLNSLLRDEDHAREFLARHQDKLLFGSDCTDSDGHGEKCYGSRTIDAIRRLAPKPEIVEKIFYRNAVRIMKIRV